MEGSAVWTATSLEHWAICDEQIIVRFYYLPPIYRGNMPEVEVEVTTTVTAEFEVFCAKCGAGLCGNCTTGNTTRRGMPFIQVDPCENCIKEAESTGESRGYDDGHGDGYSKGYDEGVESVTCNED